MMISFKITESSERTEQHFVAAVICAKGEEFRLEREVPERKNRKQKPTS